MTATCGQSMRRARGVRQRRIPIFVRASRPPETKTPPEWRRLQSRFGLRRSLRCFLLYLRFFGLWLLLDLFNGLRRRHFCGVVLHMMLRMVLGVKVRLMPPHVLLHTLVPFCVGLPLLAVMMRLRLVDLRRLHN